MVDSSGALGATRAYAAIIGSIEPDCIDADFVANEPDALRVVGLGGYEIWEVEIRLVKKFGANIPDD